MRLKNFIDNVVEKILGCKIHRGFLQYFRYLISGAFATSTDIIFLFILTHFFHINYLIAAAFSFSAGIVVNYIFNVILVFRSSGNIRKEFPVFVLIGLGGMTWTELILWILVEKLDIYVMIAKLVAVVIVLQWNFFMRKKFVFCLEPVSEGKTSEL